MKFNLFLPLGTLLLVSCAPLPPITGQAAVEKVKGHEIGLQCVQQGYVQDINSAVRYISTQQSIINNRIAPAEAAQIRAQLRTYGPPNRATCMQFQILAIQAQQAEQDKQREQAEFNQAMDSINNQTQQMQQNRSRQTLCTNIGGGMVSCNTY